MLYLDTSLLVAVFTNETDSDRMQAWLSAQEAGTLAISAWVTTEFSAALSIKLRTKEIDATERTDALSAFKRVAADSFDIFSVSNAQFRTAAAYADQYALGLRAGDALHLAISADHGATVCTLDRRLADAGEALGVKTLLI